MLRSNNILGNLGAFLSKYDKVEYPSEKTIVIGSPNSGISYAKAYAKESGLPYIQALHKERKERNFEI